MEFDYIDPDRAGGGGNGHNNLEPEGESQEDFEDEESLYISRKKLEDTNYCSANGSFVWCLPRDYNQEKHPFTCK